MSWWGEKRDAAAREGHLAPPTWARRKVRLAGGALGFALVSLLLLVPTAFAGPPSNDDFEGAEDLGSTLPVSIASSNVDATEQADDPRTLSAPQHSVWFRWEAPSGEPISIDTCNSEFATTMAVFTGSSLASLVKVGEDPNSDGRYCSTASGAAFRPVAGTVYSIMVAGNGFHLPEGPAPMTQGSFELEIAAIPQPPNDDFASPVPIETLVSSFFNEEFSYSGLAGGFNWSATKEPGEPDHAGDPGGASVWYEWTAPKSGHAEVWACTSFDVLVGLYTGNAVDALTPVALEGRPASCFVNFTAIAGTTYRIAVDGKRDTGSGLPAMTSFYVQAAVSVPVPAKAPPAGPTGESRDSTPPQTSIHRHVLKRKRLLLVLDFASSEPNSTFRCKLDKRRFAKCPSSKRYKHLGSGNHTLKVFAVDPAGNADPSPAVAHFTFPGDVRVHSRH